MTGLAHHVSASVKGQAMTDGIKRVMNAAADVGKMLVYGRVQEFPGVRVAKSWLTAMRYGHGARLSGYVCRTARVAVALDARLTADAPRTAFPDLTACAPPAPAVWLQVAYYQRVPERVAPRSYLWKEQHGGKPMTTQALSEKHRRHGLTRRQAKFVAALASGLDDHAAALKAGYAESVAAHQAQRILRSVPVQEQLRRLALAACPPARAIKRLNELIEGRVVTVRAKNEVTPDGTVISSTVERTETTDPGTSLRALRQSAEWAGYAPPEQPNVALAFNMSFVEACDESKKMWNPPSCLQRRNEALAAAPVDIAAGVTETVTETAVDAAPLQCANCDAVLCPHGLCTRCDGCDDCLEFALPPMPEVKQ